MGRQGVSIFTADGQVHYGAFRQRLGNGSGRRLARGAGHAHSALSGRYAGDIDPSSESDSRPLTNRAPKIAMPAVIAPTRLT